METVKNVLLQDEIKGRECSEYVKEFCPERLSLSGRILATEKEDFEIDSFQFSM